MGPFSCPLSVEERRASARRLRVLAKKSDERGLDLAQLRDDCLALGASPVREKLGFVG